MNTLFNYRIKIIGMAFLGISILAALITRLTQLSIIPEYDKSRQYHLSLSLVTLSLFIIAFSREKIEDERTKNIRNRSITASLLALLAITVMLSFISVLMPKSLHFDPAFDLSVISSIALAVFHVFFNTGIHADSIWNYNEEKRGLIDRKGNKKYLFILYASVVAIIILIFFV